MIFDHQITRLIRHLLDLQINIIRRRIIRQTQIADVVVAVDVIVVVVTIVLVQVPFEDWRWNDDGGFHRVLVS